jgi:hypothetical protein
MIDVVAGVPARDTFSGPRFLQRAVVLRSRGTALAQKSVRRTGVHCRIDG